MIGRFVKGKVAIFIDASNIYHSQKRLRWKVDFKKLFAYLKSEVDLFSVYFYTAYDPAYNKQKRFLDFLDIIGYRVRKKKVKFIKDKKLESELGGFHKGNLDVELTIDAIHNRDAYESFILFSGDSDFEPLIKYLKAYKKRCLVVSTKRHVAIELLKEAKFIDIKKLKEFIEMR